MHDVTIRDAREEDLPAVLELYSAAGIGGEQNFTLLEARAHLAALKQNPSFRILVALVNGSVAGTYELFIMENMAKRGKRSGIVEDVAVRPQFRGRGIGRAMMQHALEQCKQAGCYKLTLSSNLKREDAHKFYESLGFERHGYSFRVDL